MSAHICSTACSHLDWADSAWWITGAIPLSKPAWRKFLDSINHLLPCKATWVAIKDGKIIVWHDGPWWRVAECLKRTNTKADFSGLVQRRGCAPAGGPWCEVHREGIAEEEAR